MLEEFLRFAEVLSDPLLLVSAGGQLLAANTRAATMLGYRRDELVDTPFARIVRDDADKVRKLLAACARTRQAIPGALVFAHRDGSLSPCRCDGGLYRPRAGDGDEAVVLLRVSSRTDTNSRFTALNRQIAELSAEIRRRTRAEAELHKQREWFRVTLSGIGDAVIATDTSSIITFINPAACLLTGWGENDALGTPLSEVFDIVNEETRKRVESPIAKVLREGVVAGLANHTVLIRRDRTEVPIDDSAAAIRDEGGAIIGAVLVFHDITERRTLERELWHKAQALEELNRKKDEFLAMLSHELRNPLAPLRNCIAILEGRRTGDADAERLLAIMARQVAHLTRLVDDLLDVSRITTGRIRLVKQPLDLDGVVAQALEAVQPLAESRGNRLDAALQPAVVDGDEARLAQVFINLLENAIKYSPAGGAIRVRMFDRDGGAAVAVEDNGTGIDPAMLPRIFELFTQADRSLDRAQGGLGVGLALVRALVELHGGRVTAESPGTGRGSVFTVTLPQAQAPLAIAERASPAASAVDDRRILMVDDSADVAESMAILLESWGYRVRTAGSADAAMALCASFEPHVAILDVGLPGTDGYELARRMRSRFPNVRLIALTGYGMDGDRAKAREAGFEHHLTKPGDLARLRKILTEG